MSQIHVFRSLTFAVLVGALSTARVARAQEVDPISTERPTVGNSPDLIPRRSLQAENGVGVIFEKDRYVADLPETLLRFGLASRAEVRFQFGDEVYERSDAGDSHTLQSTDPAISVKLGLGKPNSIYPRSAILGLSLPIGGPEWTSGSYDPGVTAIWTQTIRKAYFLNEVAGSTLTTWSGARRMCWAPSIAGGRSLSKTVTGFAEYAPTVLADGSSNYVIDGGFAKTVRTVTQFDIRSGYLKDSTGFHALFSLGYSVRRDGMFRSLAHIF